jgi:hypothetical protein
MTVPSWIAIVAETCLPESCDPMHMISHANDEARMTIGET